MKIEAGKRYVRRDGKISGVMELRHDKIFPYFDPLHRIYYTERGMFWEDGIESGFDLISEYTPTPSPSEPQEHGEGARIAQDAPDGESGANTPAHAPQAATTQAEWQEEAILSLSIILAMVSSRITIADGSPFLDRIRDIIRRSGIQSYPITPPNLSDQSKAILGMRATLESVCEELAQREVKNDATVKILNECNAAIRAFDDACIKF